MNHLNDTRPFPIQIERGGDGSTIPWWLAEVAYKSYARCFGRDQSLERLAERGGFGRDELVGLIRKEWEKRRKAHDVTGQMNQFLEELAALLRKYEAKLSYTTDDDGIHVQIGNEDVCIGFAGRQDMSHLVKADGAQSGTEGVDSECTSPL